MVQMAKASPSVLRGSMGPLGVRHQETAGFRRSVEHIARSRSTWTFSWLDAEPWTFTVVEGDLGIKKVYGL